MRAGVRLITIAVMLGLVALLLAGPLIGANAAVAQPLGLHLTLGNPSGAVTDVAQPNNYLIERPQYALAYQRDAGIPAWVSWHLESQDIGSTSRGNFVADTSLPAGWYRVDPSDYSGSGYDRGHMTPSGDRTSSHANNDATFIMSNIIPQAPDNNQGPWASLENYCRSLLTGNELYIMSGGWGSKGTLAGGQLQIPAYTWKVIVVLPIGSDDASRVTASTRVIGIWMPNQQGIRSTSWQSYRVSVDSIEATTGYDFLSAVPAEIQAVVEAQVDGTPPGTPGPTFTPTATSATATPTAPMTPTATATPLATATASLTATATSIPLPLWELFLPFIAQVQTVSPTATPGPTPSLTPGPTATVAPTVTATASPTAPPSPTTTPMVTATPVAAMPGCSGSFSTTPPNAPIQIEMVDKQAETVTLHNSSAQPVALDGWWICSITGRQLHAVLSGTIAPGASLLIASQAGSPIWSNSNPDPAALFDFTGTQIAYRSQ